MALILMNGVYRRMGSEKKITMVINCSFAVNSCHS